MSNLSGVADQLQKILNVVSKKTKQKNGFNTNFIGDTVYNYWSEFCIILH